MQFFFDENKQTNKKMNSFKNHSRSPTTTTTIKIDMKRMEKALIALLRMPGLFLIDNYFKYFNYNWSIRHRDWNLLLSHFGMLVNKKWNFYFY